VTKRKSRRPAFRGLFTRFVAIVLGLALGAGIIYSMQLPFQNEHATLHVSLSSLTSDVGEAPAITWPGVGSAALDIPALGVTRAWHNKVVPIASLTKMMTAFVVLQRFPLAVGQTGPCITVTDAEVTNFNEEKSEDDSAVIVAAGEQLCESDLLNGMLVHSAANYADILASMVSPTPEAFVARMNETAERLGLRNTHYADDTGVSDESVSTALDQAKLAALLMDNPLVRDIVDQMNVDLPYAGFVNSFTPYVGTENVIGVKSGRTAAAGGCDVMAVAFIQNGQRRILYAVVLGQQGGNLLGPAGDAALALAQSALANRFVHTFARGTTLGTISFGHRTVPVGFARESRVYWWAQHNSDPFTLRLRDLANSVRKGEVIGWIDIRGNAQPLALVALGSVAAPTLYQRLR
jgi:D-alanyl-D-alanine carboxypeptidase (penicillin-binding protein 5/6)